MEPLGGGLRQRVWGGSPFLPLFVSSRVCKTKALLSYGFGAIVEENVGPNVFTVHPGEDRGTDSRKRPGHGCGRMHDTVSGLVAPASNTEPVKYQMRAKSCVEMKNSSFFLSFFPKSGNLTFLCGIY